MLDRYYLFTNNKDDTLEMDRGEVVKVKVWFFVFVVLVLLSAVAAFLVVEKVFEDVVIELVYDSSMRMMQSYLRERGHGLYDDANTEAQGFNVIYRLGMIIAVSLALFAFAVSISGLLVYGAGIWFPPYGAIVLKVWLSCLIGCFLGDAVHCWLLIRYEVDNIGVFHIGRFDRTELRDGGRVAIFEKRYYEEADDGEEIEKFFVLDLKGWNEANLQRNRMYVVAIDEDYYRGFLPLS